MATIGDRIKLKRKELGLTQAELGAKINVTDRAVSKWEQNEGNPDMSIIASLANVLNVSLDYLILGKEDDPITLDDMDAEKRLTLLIKRDDAENFKKYSYHTSAHLFGREQDMSMCFHHGMNKRVVVTTLNSQTWKEIIAAKATKIFNVCLEELVKKNNTDGFWITHAVSSFLDEFVIAIVDLDRDDILKAIGGAFFAIEGSGNFSNPNQAKGQQPILVGPSNYVSDKQAYFIKEETLRYIFEKADSSPRCFSYMTTIQFKGLTADRLQTSNKGEEYLVTFMESKILELAVEFEKYDIIEKFLPQCDEALDSIGQSQFEFYTILGTYYYRDSYKLVEGRVYFFAKSFMESLLLKGQIELAKKLNSYNSKVKDKFKNWPRLYNRDGENIQVMSDADIDRFIKLHSDLPEDEMTRLRCVRDGLIVRGEVSSLRDLKLIRELLDNNYYHYYEMVYDKLNKGQTKELFEFFVDNNLDELEGYLMRGPEGYPELLKRAFSIFTAQKGTSYYTDHKDIIGRQNSIGFEDTEWERRARERGEKTFRTQFTREHGSIEKYSGLLEGNLIIDHIKELKEEIYNNVVNAIEAEKQRKKEAAEREKMAKGLTKSYFDNLLNSGKEENLKLFKLELCSLLDAIFLYDYHYAGEDFSERMNEHFKALESTIPQERTMDDGWGYQVPDTGYTEEVVIPARNRVSHLRDIFYRLRVIRNNILHPEKVKVEELTEAEMRECLEYVFSINKKVEE